MDSWLVAHNPNRLRLFYNQSLPSLNILFLFYDLQSGNFLISDESDMSHKTAEQDIIVALGFRQSFMVPGATKLSLLGCSYFW